MTDADLRLYSGATEYGTIGNPITFGAVIAGNEYEHTLNPLYLWNDKGGILGSVPAKTVTIEVLNMWLQNENMGTSDGTPSQTFTADVIPLIDNSDTTEIVVKVGVDEWDRVGSLVGEASTATVYTIDAVTGIVTFGNGVNGAIPPNGQVIYITYMPDLLAYGKDIYDEAWLSVKSFGVTTNPVAVVDEMQISTDTTHVTIANTILQIVSGVWLQSDPTHAGTNYYTGGSFNGLTGVITLGTPLPSTNTPVLINYTYVIIDDIEALYTPIGMSLTHTFVNQIPKNNAKLLFFKLDVPTHATPSGGSSVSFRIRLTYKQ